MIECVLNYTVTYVRKLGVKLDNKQWYDRVPKSVETMHEGKVTMTELLLTINRTSKSVVIKKEHAC
jgi:uncharacterized protein YdiU (UPF0061 family)